MYSFGLANCSSSVENLAWGFRNQQGSQIAVQWSTLYYIFAKFHKRGKGCPILRGHTCCFSPAFPCLQKLLAKIDTFWVCYFTVSPHFRSWKKVLSQG